MAVSQDQNDEELEAVENEIIAGSRYATYVQLLTEDENDVHRRNIYG